LQRLLLLLQQLLNNNNKATYSFYSHQKFKPKKMVSMAVVVLPLPL
jgi:hypothetical protein